MKTILKKLIKTGAILMVLCTASCMDYLDRAPEADITELDAFNDFESFQGFTEELYSCIVDISKPTWTGEWNLADDILHTTTGNFRMSHQFDLGNYWDWINNGWGNSWLHYGGGANTQPDSPHNKGVWQLSWYGIRKANLGLANLDLLLDATQEEKDVVEGQLLFFRGFFHFTLMSFWGGLPYIDELLASGERHEIPRLSYRETALKAAEDFAAAAELLPANWDTSQPGQATLNNNQQRVTKSAAYGYLGKNLLYAASPMMNRESTGNATYDVELCTRAADAFAKVLQLSDNGDAPFRLLSWANYHENWYTISSYGKAPGYPEVLLGPPSYNPGNSRWSLAAQFVPPTVGGDAAMAAPSANYVNNFGMANGLPIDEPDSGYDISDPWSNRDPRFHYQIIVDGDRIIQGSGGPDEYRYAQLFNGGNMRSEVNASRTGYMYKKFTAPGSNGIDNEWNFLNIVMPYLRLADVYLMYAEAVLHGYGSPTSSHNGHPLTAVEAVNIVRDRANVPPVDARFLVSKEVFMEELIRERAVELSFEGLRWHDLRRWMLAGEPQYTEKTAIDFERGPDGKPVNLRERVIINRVFEERHNWLPLPVSQVNLYPDFGQNPGW